MATVDSDGYPQIRIIDVMAVENNNLYFLTFPFKRIDA